MEQGDALRREVDQALRTFLGTLPGALSWAGPELLQAITAFLAGGKRLRPAFCYWGWRGAGGEDCPQIVTAAAALELLHAGALVHDDIIDASDTRRGRPAMHREFEARHRASGWRGAPDAFGRGAAILVGDLLLCWTGDMLRASGLPEAALQRGRPVLGLMCTEMITGQYLDLRGQAGGPVSVDEALRVAAYKTATYTVQRPLQLGGALAGMGPPARAARVRAVFETYGQALGVAFQLRDDVLGVFADPGQTGKPAGGDIREGKRTVLFALASERATPAQAQALRRHLGNPLLDAAGLAEVRAVITESGALAECERMIGERVSRALDALARSPLAAEARQALAGLAVAVTARSG